MTPSLAAPTARARAALRMSGDDVPLWPRSLDGDSDDDDDDGGGGGGPFFGPLSATVPCSLIRFQRRAPSPTFSPIESLRRSTAI